MLAPLRWLAVGSNLGLVVYGALHPSPITLAIAGLLLPVNVYRAVEVTRLTRRVARAQADADLAGLWLKPYMKPRRFKAGHVLFRKGDQANRLYMLVDGAMELVEIGQRLEPGRIFGEIALFSPSGLRTHTVRCIGACSVQPSSVSSYTTLGGTSAYAWRATSPSRSRSRNVSVSTFALTPSTSVRRSPNRRPLPRPSAITTSADHLLSKRANEVRVDQIASRFGTSTAELIQANGLPGNVRLGAGSRLLVPGDSDGNGDSLQRLLGVDGSPIIIQPEVRAHKAVRGTGKGGSKNVRATSGGASPKG